MFVYFSPSLNSGTETVSDFVFNKLTWQKQMYMMFTKNYELCMQFFM